MRGSSGLANGQPISFLVPVLISTVTGYSLTLLMAVIFRALLRQRPFITWGVSILVVLAAAGMFAVIDAWVFSTQNRTSDRSEESRVGKERVSKCRYRWSPSY